MNLKKASGKKKSIAVSWKKVSGAEGYEISYSTKSSFKKAKKVTVGKKAKHTFIREPLQRFPFSFTTSTPELNSTLFPKLPIQLL